jgi:hypothetical protein
MKRFLVAALFSFGLWGASAGQLFAQIGTYTPPYMPGPAVSPYLNLFRNNPAINYYGIVQPQLQTAQQLQQIQTYLNQPLNANQATLGTGVPVQNQMVTTTGHPVMFQNYSYYYPVYSGGGGGGLGGGFGGAGMPFTGSYFPTVINNQFRR